MPHFLRDEDNAVSDRLALWLLEWTQSNEWLQFGVHNEYNSSENKKQKCSRSIGDDSFAKPDPGC